MELEDLHLNYHYFITDLSYTVREGAEDVYIEEYQNIFKDAWELQEKGGEYPTCKNPNPNSWFQPQPNNVKLFHKRTNITLYINALSLSKTKPHGEPFNNKNNCNLDIGEVYDYSLHSLNSLSDNSSKLQLQIQETLQDKYSPSNIKNTYERAMQQEFKVEKRTREEKIRLILAKLNFLIEDSLEKNNKIGFEVLTKRYSMIKNMIK